MNMYIYGHFSKDTILFLGTPDFMGGIRVVGEASRGLGVEGF